jgi:hypothetical protein
MMPLSRPRWFYALCALIVIVLGLASRKLTGLPPFISIHAGDTLWALLVFILIGWLAPRWPIWRVAGAALLFAFAIELSQLYQAPWLNELRQHTLIALVIGRGFVWWDLLRYSIGIGLGVAMELIFLPKLKHS